MRFKRAVYLKYSGDMPRDEYLTCWQISPGRMDCLAVAAKIRWSKAITCLKSSFGGTPLLLTLSQMFTVQLGDVVVMDRK